MGGSSYNNYQSKQSSVDMPTVEPDIDNSSLNISTQVILDLVELPTKN